MEWNDIRDDVGRNLGVYDNPYDLTDRSWTVMRFYEEELPQKGLQWLIVKDGCLHCEDPGCLRACPAPGAIVQFANGIVDFQQENCIGCGYCQTGCPFNIPRYSLKDQKAYKCTLCSDRVAVGLEPACIKSCPTQALTFGSKQDMLDLAHERVQELNERGFQKASIYDPSGVGGTHVMYVLQHADRPDLYALPNDPKISPLVSLWKGAGKPLAMASSGTARMRGDIPAQIVSAEEQDHADLIVMASHGRAGLDAFWSGSIAPKVLHRVHAPMLIRPPSSVASV